MDADNSAGGNPEYARTKLLSQITGPSESFYNKRRLTGDGPPYIKVGKVVLYHVATAKAWLQQHTRRSTSERLEVS